MSYSFNLVCLVSAANKNFISLILPSFEMIPNVKSRHCYINLDSPGIETFRSFGALELVAILVQAY